MNVYPKSGSTLVRCATYIVDAWSSGDVPSFDEDTDLQASGRWVPLASNHRDS